MDKKRKMCYPPARPRSDPKKEKEEESCQRRRKRKNQCRRKYAKNTPAGYVQFPRVPNYVQVDPVPVSRCSKNSTAWGEVCLSSYPKPYPLALISERPAAPVFAPCGLSSVVG